MSYPTSAAWQSAVRQNQQMVTRLDVCDPTGVVLKKGLHADTGSVTADQTRAVRRDCTFTIPDPNLKYTPTGPASLLSAQSGNELRPYRGFQYANGTTELVPLGVFPIRSCPVATGTSGPVVTLGGQDRSSTVSRARWTAPYVIPKGTTLEDALTGIINSRAPYAGTNFPTTGITLATARTLGLDSSNDPWADAQQLATSFGLDLYFDVTGTAVLTTPTDPTTAVPTVNYYDDSLAITWNGAKSNDSSTAYNGVIVIVESADLSTTLLRVEVWDDDPNSPTYYLGPYGMFPEFLTIPGLTADQATTTGRNELARHRGVAQSLSWSQIVDASLDPGDAISYQSHLLNVPALTVVLDSITIPWLAGDSATAQTRSQQVVGFPAFVPTVAPVTIPGSTSGGTWGTAATWGTRTTWS